MCGLVIIGWHVGMVTVVGERSLGIDGTHTLGIDGMITFGIDGTNTMVFMCFDLWCLAPCIRARPALHAPEGLEPPYPRVAYGPPRTVAGFHYYSVILLP